MKVTLTDEGIDMCFDDNRFVGVERARDAWHAELNGTQGPLSAASLALLARLVAESFAARAVKAIELRPDMEELKRLPDAFGEFARQAQDLLDEIKRPRASA